MQEDLYKEYILEVYKNLKNKKEIKDPTNTYVGYNASCGDNIKLYLRVKDKKVEDISYTTEGCLISQVSAELLVEELKKKPIDYIKELSEEKLFNIVGITPSLGRRKCVLLAYSTLQTNL